MPGYLIIGLEHSDGCDAIEIDPDRCTCAATVRVSRREDEWRSIGELRPGWTHADLIEHVALRGTFGAQTPTEN